MVVHKQPSFSIKIIEENGNIIAQFRRNIKMKCKKRMYFFVNNVERAKGV